MMSEPDLLLGRTETKTTIILARLYWEFLGYCKVAGFSGLSLGLGIGISCDSLAEDRGYLNKNGAEIVIRAVS